MKRRRRRETELLTVPPGTVPLPLQPLLFSLLIIPFSLPTTLDFFLPGQLLPEIWSPATVSAPGDLVVGALPTLPVAVHGGA
jgi:hypothetical protein